MVVSASGKWIPHNGGALLSRLTLPVVKAPTIPADASATANGAITFGTAVGTAYAKCFCYFAANVVNATQPAGFYYMEMSSTTAAIVYNNLYTPAAGVYPTEPTSKTAFSGAVPGGAGSTSEVTALIYTLPANLLGLYGTVISEVYFEASNSADAKTIRQKLSSTTLNSQVLTTSPHLHGFAIFRNSGSGSLQRSIGNFQPTATPTIAVVGTVDTTASQSITITIQTGTTATDWCALSIFNSRVEVA